MVTTPYVRAELLAHAPQGVAPGQPLWLGLSITHQPEWHTYWKNPGDSGLPTELTWQLPAGLDVGETAWPVPSLFRIGKLANYGYGGQVLLTAPLQVPASFQPPAGGNGQIEVQVYAASTLGNDNTAIAGVRGGTIEQTRLAMAAGLTNAPDASVQRAAPAVVPTEIAATPEPVQQMAPVPAPGALVIDKPLRSGQQVYARGRDLVVMAMVNPGAEVIADGHIHVYAPLRGKAIAGARGNAEARIFALSMDPELISIAGIYRTSDTPLPASVLGKAAQVRLVPGPDGEKLVIEPLNP